MSHPLFDLSGQKALVTGAGRGIGRVLAVGLAEAGADVAIADIDLGQADEGKNAIESARAPSGRASMSGSTYSTISMFGSSAWPSGRSENTPRKGSSA